MSNQLILTDSENREYENIMSFYLNSGKNDISAEKETIKDLKQIFPRLQFLIKKTTKIAI